MNSRKFLVLRSSLINSATFLSWRVLNESLSNTLRPKSAKWLPKFLFPTSSVIIADNLSSALNQLKTLLTETSIKSQRTSGTPFPLRAYTGQPSLFVAGVSVKKSVTKS